MKLLEYFNIGLKKKPLHPANIDVSARTLYEVGQRANNEDYYYPQGDVSTHIHIVCDGVGGAAKGEIASKMAAQAIYSVLIKSDSIDPERTIQEAIDNASTALFEHARNAPLSSGLGTTVAICWITGGKAYLTHIGDSRIYYYRGSELIYGSKDHSMVNDLIASGIITEEQAKHHPRRNVITKALTGKYDGLESLPHKVNATIKVIHEIYGGDEILLCSDGVLESYETATITELVGLKKVSIPHKLNMIKTKCGQGSKDNHTLTWLTVKSKN